MILRIDAHHHLWQYDPSEFGWIEGDLVPLRRDFLSPHLQREMRNAGVHGSIAVQARQSEEETMWLLQLAEQTPEILGVVGWLDIAAADFAHALDRYKHFSLLKGLRHVVQAEAPGFLEGEAFDAGMRQLLGTGMVYDLLVFERQLEEAIRFVDRHPQQLFVLDHIAKPDIRNGRMDTWAHAIRAMAQRPNVVCKLSGMVTEADPHRWTTEQLEPYFQVVLEAFTPQRLMIGTDWPVLLAGCDYGEWWRTVETWIAPLTMTEQEAVLGQTAVRTYRLHSRSPQKQNGTEAQQSPRNPVQS